MEKNPSSEKPYLKSLVNYDLDLIVIIIIFLHFLSFCFQKYFRLFQEAASNNNNNNESGPQISESFRFAITSELSR